MIKSEPPNNRFNLTQRFGTLMGCVASLLAQSAPIPLRKLSVCSADALRSRRKFHPKDIDNLTSKKMRTIFLI